jgi:HAUS augmin-like complex subunit 5
VQELLDMDVNERLNLLESESHGKWATALHAEAERIREAVTHAEVVKQRSNEWWEQPAQHCTPDVPVGQSTFGAELAALCKLAEE